MTSHLKASFERRKNKGWMTKITTWKRVASKTCERIVGQCFSFTTGFSQVMTASIFNGNRLNGFPNQRRSRTTWLKPGVNERRFSTFGAKPLGTAFLAKHRRNDFQSHQQTHFTASFS